MSAMRGRTLTAGGLYRFVGTCRRRTTDNALYRLRSYMDARRRLSGRLRGGSTGLGGLNYEWAAVLHRRLSPRFGVADEPDHFVETGHYIPPLALECFALAVGQAVESFHLSGYPSRSPDAA